MGGSGQWIKSLMSLKKPDKDDQFGTHGKGRRWKLWRSSSGSRAGSCKSETSETSSVVGPADAFNAALAAVARAPARDFKILRQEWAAIRIQTAFRAFLARRALRALKAIVRIQALVRGHQVRKQAAVTLKCMHALARVQARVRARRAHLSAEGLETNDTRSNGRENTDDLEEAKERWCSGRGTLSDVSTKLQIKQEGAIKRERALSYALSQLQKRSMQSTRPPSPSAFSRKARDIEKSSCDLTWLDRWMATKPWEDQESGTLSPDSTCRSKTPDEAHPRRNSHHSDSGSIKVRKNNMTTRVSTRPPLVPTNSRYESQSTPSSETMYNGSSKSSPVTPASKNIGRGDAGKPSYMNATKAVKARQEAVNAERQIGARRQASGDLQCFTRVAFTSVDSDINAASNNSYKGRSSMRRSLDKENYLY